MLTGALVRLRAIEMDDLDRYLAWVNDDGSGAVPGDAGGPSRCRVSRRRTSIRATVTQTRPPEIAYAIETLEGAAHIGSVSLHRVGAVAHNCGARHHDRRQGVLGPRLRHGRDHDGASFAFDDLNLNRVWLSVDADNGRAIACYRKCGFVEEGRLRQDRYRDGQYRDTIVMGVLRDEFEALHHTGG